MNRFINNLCAFFTGAAIITLLLMLTACVPPGYGYGHSYYRPDPPRNEWGQRYYQHYGNHYRYTPQYDRVIYDQPMQYPY